MNRASKKRMFAFFRKPNLAQGNAMTTNTILSTSNHPKFVLSSLKVAPGLPFSEVLPAEGLFEEIKNIEYRDRIYTPDVTVWAFLSQVLNDDQSQQAAVARVISHFSSQGREVPSANTAAYSKARSRLPDTLLVTQAQNCAQELKAMTLPGWRWKNKDVNLVDGSTLSMPDTLENQAVYPQPCTQKKGAGFPLARIVTVASHASGAMLDLAIGPWSGKETGEHALLRKILHVFKPGDVALGDCYYASFFLIAMLLEMEVDAVFPIHGARHNDFRRGKRLGKKDHLVQWKKPARPTWMDKETYDKFPDFITVREVVVNNSRDGYRSRSRVVATTFLKSKEASKKELALLYDYRWCVELDLRSIKETMHMGILRGKTPAMVHKEIWAHILAYNLIRKIMAQAALIHNKKPREISFKLALQMINAFRQAGILSEKNKDNYLRLLKAICYKKIGNRPGRREPRRIKRRPKAFPRMQKSRHLYQKEIAGKNCFMLS
jgi:hypothetical protein